MKPSPPASLVRLAEADVVRLCGLAAAAGGLALLARHAVSHTEREGNRLRATVEQDGRAYAVWIEPGDPPHETTRWRCECPAASGDTADTPYALGCAHVAAVLFAWIRTPADFATPWPSITEIAAPPASPATAAPARKPPPAEQMTQPRLLRPPSEIGSAATLAAELERLPGADLSALARRVLNADLAAGEARAALDTALRSPDVLTSLLARLESGPRDLLAQVLLLGGAVTAADLDGIAARSGRAASGLQSEMATLVRHGFVFTAPAAPAGNGSGEAARSWRQISGWRVPTDLRPLLPITLPIPAALRPLLAAAHSPEDISRAPKGSPPSHASGERQARVTRAMPLPLLQALALLPRAPGPLNPYAAAAHSREMAPPPRTAAGRAPFPLVPGDLTPGSLAALARGLWVAPGLAQLARRLLLWSREAGADFALHDLARLPESERPLALRGAFAVWRRAELPAELADLDLPGSPIRAGYDPAHAALRPASLAVEIVDAREFALRLLAAADVGMWYRLSDLRDLVWRIAPLFLRGRQRAYAAPAWWLRTADDPRPLRPTVREEWEAGEGHYLAALLAGPLHWLGALDLAHAPDGSLLAVRLTALGAFLLDRRETPASGNLGRAETTAAAAPIEQGAVTISRAEDAVRIANYGRRGEEAGTTQGQAPPTRVNAPRPAAGDALFVGNWGAPMLAAREGTLLVHPLAAGAELLDALEVWARAEAVAGGRLIYRLAADRACAALDSGLTPDALLAHLDACDARYGTRIAPGVRARLEAWRAAYGAARIELGWTVIEARDEAMLTEVLTAVPEIAARCRRIAPDIALVAEADASALRSTLMRRGFLM
jgi:hypothetical protein